MTATYRPHDPEWRPRTAEQRIRDTIVALADWLTDQDGYDVPWEVLVAACPDGTEEKTIRDSFTELLHEVAKRTDRTDLPFAGQVELDYMTGVRK
jgi:hypothetical protein